MSSYPPRSAAISSRRGRSRSPTTAGADRRSNSLSAHSSMGLVMHKHAATVADHPAEQPSRGSSGGRAIGKQDSRDDEQARAKAVGSGSSSPSNVSSAAAAAAAVAASFASNSTGNKRTREDKSSSAAPIDTIPTIGTDDMFSQPPRKQGRKDVNKKGGGDSPSHAAWPVSPVGSNKAQGADAPAVTSSSSASGLSPIKLEEKGQAGNDHSTPKLLTHSLDTPPTSFDGGRDKTTTKEGTANPAATLVDSPLGPPEIQNSHRHEQQQKPFSPKTFFAVCVSSSCVLRLVLFDDATNKHTHL